MSDIIVVSAEINEFFESDHIEHDHTSSTVNMFCLEIFGYAAYIPVRDGVEDLDTDNWEYGVFEQSSDIKFDELLSDDRDYSKQIIVGILEFMRVPYDDSVVDGIVRFASEMASKYGCQRKVLGFQVVINAVVLSAVHEEDEQLVSLRRSAIADLQEVKATEWMMDTTCSICLNEFEVESSVASLPCNSFEAQPGKSHMFHRNCIAKWLEKENTCPLCRFKIY